MSWLNFGLFDNLVRIRRKEYGRNSRLIRPSEPMPKDDYLSRPGATKLAQRIEQHWKARGIKGVRAWVDEGLAPSGVNNMTVCGVRSNLIDGLPPCPSGSNGCLSSPSVRRSAS